MKKQVQHVLSAVTAVAVGAFAIEMHAQRRAPGEARAKQGVQVALNVGSQTYQSAEPGRCTHAPTASIYQVVSQMWSVQQSSDGRSLTLTFWKPKDGSAEMINLSVRNATASHNVNTVRGGSGSSGSGKITFANSGEGGTFIVDAKTKDGTAITGRIACDAFAPHTAEGGLLAHARIHQGDLEGAREELGRVLALQGDRRDEAKRLPDRLR